MKLAYGRITVALQGKMILETGEVKGWTDAMSTLDMYRKDYKRFAHVVDNKASSRRKPSRHSSNKVSVYPDEARGGVVAGAASLRTATPGSRVPKAAVGRRRGTGDSGAVVSDSEGGNFTDLSLDISTNQQLQQQVITALFYSSKTFVENTFLCFFL
uniref:Uncharacterized protein n=1 Tax=Branchiostoma floridae TaxID=7739 RepID=C3Y866_BRAFL|eukprot:XP_002607525.1 hypothetical protein BRAFLDRAFT_106473 [Branchiostoma floridae]